MPTALIWQGRLHLAAGDLVTVQRSLDGLAAVEERIAPVQRAYGQVLAARLLLAQGRPRDALSLLERLLVAAQEGELVRHALESELLVAVALAACRQGHDARQRLRLVLARACAEGFLRLFLDEGEPVAALVRALLPSLTEPALRAYARTIARAFTAAGGRPAAAVTPADGLPVEPLSAGERRVLRLLAAGRSNAEIARELGVSVNTIKGHVKSIYRKLDVSNRLEATDRARQLARH
jgi:LuxR family maltose regulon positive regulatory protein